MVRLVKGKIRRGSEASSDREWPGRSRRADQRVVEGKVADETTAPCGAVLVESLRRAGQPGSSAMPTLLPVW